MIRGFLAFSVAFLVSGAVFAQTWDGPKIADHMNALTGGQKALVEENNSLRVEADTKCDSLECRAENYRQIISNDTMLITALYMQHDDGRMILGNRSYISEISENITLMITNYCDKKVAFVIPNFDQSCEIKYLKDHADILEQSIANELKFFGHTVR